MPALLKQLASVRKIDELTLVRRGTDGDWVSADNVKGLSITKSIEPIVLQKTEPTETKSIQPEPTSRTAKVTPTKSRYWWLEKYVSSLWWIGSMMGVIGILSIAVGFTSMNGVGICFGIGLIIGGCSVFPLAQLVELALDAKKDLETIADRLRR